MSALAAIFGDKLAERDAFGRPKWSGAAYDFIDELALTSDDPVAASSGLIGTPTSTGTFAQADAAYGIALMTAAATTDNDGYQIQEDNEWILPKANYQLVWRGCVKASDVTQLHKFMGPSITDTTIVDGADGTATLTASAAIGFLKVDGSANLMMVVVTGSAIVASATIPGLTLEDDTYYYLEFTYTIGATTGVGNMRCEVISASGVKYAAYMDVSGGPTTEMANAVAWKTGNATGTKTVSLDYFGAIQTR